MSSFNLVVLMGNVTRSVEVKYTPKGTAVAEIGLAVNRVWKDESGRKNEECTFVDVTFFGRQAEIAGEFVSKGDPLHISGRLRLDTWDDKQTGNKRSKLRVVGESLQLLGRKKDDNAPPSNDTRREKKEPSQRQAPPHDPDLDADKEDDIPWS